MRWTAALVLVAACGFRSPDGSGGPGDGGPGGGGDDARPGTDADVISAPWWDPAWSSRMRIVVNNATPLPQGFQLGVPRDLDLAPCGGPRDAVRVVRDHATELPRVIDELDGGDWIWFRIAAPLPAAVGPSEYWLYCGNAAAGPAPSDPTAVFDAYDGFEGSALSSAWRMQNQVSVGGSAVTLGGTNAGIHSVAAYGAGTATDFVLQPSSGAVASPWFWGGFEVQFTVTAPWVIWHARNPSMIRQEVYRAGPGPSTANERAIENGARLYGVEHYGTSAGFRYQNAPAGTLAYGGSIGSMNVRVHNYQSGGTIQLLMARVRKAVNPIPAVTLGEIEPRP
jgi:hypothetical protein